MDLKKIVIAGAGTMGSSMAQIYAKYFDDVVLLRRFFLKMLRF